MSQIDPVAIDTELAELHAQHDAIMRDVYKTEDDAHREAGDKQVLTGRTRVWDMSLACALSNAPKATEKHNALFRALAEVQARISELDAIYQASPWTRFYPAVTNSAPHIHSSTHCQTLHRGQHMTTMTWATQMSGTTEAKAVEELDEALCSVCFPSAPVALREYVSKRSQAEAAARAAEKEARNAAKAMKTLAPAEVFKDAHGWRVETVAAAKAVIRAAIDTEHYYPNTWAQDGAKYTDAAVLAEIVLIGRELSVPGSGATTEDIAKIKANTRKRIAREQAANR